MSQTRTTKLPHAGFCLPWRRPPSSWFSCRRSPRRRAGGLSAAATRKRGRPRFRANRSTGSHPTYLRPPHSSRRCHPMPPAFHDRPAHPERRPHLRRPTTRRKIRSATSSSSASCRRVRKGTQSRDELPRIEDEIRVVDRAFNSGQSQLDRGCYDQFLFTKTFRNTPQCKDLARQVDVSKRRLVGSGGAPSGHHRFVRPIVSGRHYPRAGPQQLRRQLRRHGAPPQ